jgi:hypothetical protein
VSGQPGFHPDARGEMRAAADLYDLERPGLGTEFLGEVERTPRQLPEHPRSSPVVLGQVRERAVLRSPSMVVCSARDGGIYVSAVARNSRRPFSWRDRM